VVVTAVSKTTCRSEVAMTAYEIYSVLREIPEDALHTIRLEFLDTWETNDMDEESFNTATQVRFTVEQVGPDQYSYTLRIL
jgi:hypothetical protein